MSEWTQSTIRELLRCMESGKRPYGGADEETEGVPSLGGENINKDGTIETSVLKRVPQRWYDLMPKGRLQPKDILINKDGAQTGKVALFDRTDLLPAGINEHLFLLRSDLAKVDQDYLFYQLLRPEIQNQIARRITGSAQPGLGSGFCDHVTIPHPRSIEQQRNLATILSVFDRAIRHTEALIAKYQQIKAGLMHDLFTSGITPGGELRVSFEEAPDLYKQSALGWIPKQWEAKCLSSISSLITKGATPTTYGYDFVEDYSPGRARFLRATNATPEGIYRDPDPRFIHPKAHSLLYRSQVAINDAIVSIVGARVGTSFRVGNDILPANINQNVALIRVDPSKACPAFISAIIASDTVQRQIALLVTTQAQPSLSLKQVGNFIVPVPDMAEQERIFIRIEKAADQRHSLIVELGKLQNVKLSLMNSLLGNHVTIPSDCASCE